MPGVGLIVSSSTSPAQERRRLIDLKSELARGYNPDDANTLALAQDAINAAIRVYNRYNWPWEVMSHTLAIASSTSDYTLPTWFKAPLALHLTSSGRKNKRLGYIPYDTFVTEYDLKRDGEPFLYTVKNHHETGQVTLYPRPGSAYTAEIDYYRRTPLLTSDQTPCDFPPEAEEGVMAWAWYEFAKRVGGDFGAARIATAYADARNARTELVAMVAERGDQQGYL
jgi:hypothetical protein